MHFESSFEFMPQREVGQPVHLVWEAERYVGGKMTYNWREKRQGETRERGIGDGGSLSTGESVLSFPSGKSAELRFRPAPWTCSCLVVREMHRQAEWLLSYYNIPSRAPGTLVLFSSTLNSSVEDPSIVGHWSPLVWVTSLLGVKSNLNLSSVQTQIVRAWGHNVSDQVVVAGRVTYSRVL